MHAFVCMCVCVCSDCLIYMCEHFLVCVSASVTPLLTDLNEDWIPICTGSLPAHPNYNAAEPERVQARLCGALHPHSLIRAHTHTLAHTLVRRLSPLSGRQTTTIRRTAHICHSHTHMRYSKRISTHMRLCNMCSVHL